MQSKSFCDIIAQRNARWTFQIEIFQTLNRTQTSTKIAISQVVNGSIPPSVSSSCNNSVSYSSECQSHLTFRWIMRKLVGMIGQLEKTTFSSVNSSTLEIIRTESRHEMTWVSHSTSTFIIISSIASCIPPNLTTDFNAVVCSECELFTPSHEQCRVEESFWLSANWNYWFHMKWVYGMDPFGLLLKIGLCVLLPSSTFDAVLGRGRIEWDLRLFQVQSRYFFLLASCSLSRPV